MKNTRMKVEGRGNNTQEKREPKLLSFLLEITSAHGQSHTCTHECDVHFVSETFSLGVYVFFQPMVWKTALRSLDSAAM